MKKNLSETEQLAGNINDILCFVGILCRTVIYTACIIGSIVIIGVFGGAGVVALIMVFSLLVALCYI